MDRLGLDRAGASQVELVRHIENPPRHLHAVTRVGHGPQQLAGGPEVGDQLVA
jgi:hypothetical protein